MTLPFEGTKLLAPWLRGQPFEALEGLALVDEAELQRVVQFPEPAEVCSSLFPSERGYDSYKERK